MAGVFPRVVVATALFLTACGAVDVADPAASTGVDVSGLAPFWRVAEQLRRDESPPAGDWDAIFATPGYALMAQHDHADQNLRTLLPLALMPSRAAERSEITDAGGSRSILVEHLRAAAEPAEVLGEGDHVFGAPALAGIERLRERFAR